MASGGDVMDILNVPRAGRGELQGLLSSPPPKPERERKRKPGTFFFLRSVELGALREVVTQYFDDCGCLFIVNYLGETGFLQ